MDNDDQSVRGPDTVAPGSVRRPAGRRHPRRAILAAFIGALATTSGMCQTVLAQGVAGSGLGDIDRDTFGRIAELEVRAGQLLDSLEGAPVPLGPNAANRFLERSRALRRELAGELNILRPRDRQWLIRIERRDLAAMLSTGAVPLLWTGEAMPAAGAGDPKASGGSDLVAVLWSDALGPDLTAGFSALVAADPAQASRYAAVLDAVRAKRWSRATEGIVRLLDAGYERKFVGRVREHLGAAAAKRFLTVASAELAPFVGWTLLAVDLLVRVKEAWPRLAGTVR